MMTWTLGTIAATSLWAGGYLFAARRAGKQRDQLLQSMADQRLADYESGQQAGHELAEVSRVADELREAMGNLVTRGEAIEDMQRELHTVSEQLAQSDAKGDHLEAEIRRALEPVAAREDNTQSLKQELQQLLAPLLAREGQADAVQRAIATALDPVVSQERLAQSLRTLPVGKSRADLPQLLDAIVARAGLVHIVLSDAQGLAVAHSARTDKEAEALAAIASAYIALSERYPQFGQPAPVAFVATDTDRQSVVHRIFIVAGQRYVLSAKSKSRSLTPLVLDAALDKIEYLMAKEHWET
ncbi:MAG: hypothetical protein B7733_11155 [Myxococcales bacterium FL481]|nr:MAG: hypothetical protein B7733_11155 [Myxococcales bacterium FL481]